FVVQIRCDGHTLSSFFQSAVSASLDETEFAAYPRARQRDRDDRERIPHGPPDDPHQRGSRNAKNKSQNQRVQHWTGGCEQRREIAAHNNVTMRVTAKTKSETAIRSANAG